MFKVVWKSFKYNRKNFLSFFMSEILSVAVIFMLIYIQEALSQVPGIKTEALQFAYQSELRKQLRIIIPCIILIMILVTGYSVKAYINTRIWDYKLFQLLGIRKKNLKVMIGLEYVISGMLACGFGNAGILDKDLSGRSGSNDYRYDRYYHDNRKNCSMAFI